MKRNTNSNNTFVKLPDSELKVMQIIWDMHKRNEKIDAGSMMNTYPQIIGHLKLTTVLTLITRLSEKKFIQVEKQGRINYYTPLFKEEDYKHKATAEFVENIYKSNSVNLMSALFDMGALSKDDIEEFRKQILDKEE